MDGRTLYAATGDAVARLEEAAGGGWTVAVSLPGSGAQCLAVDPADRKSLYAGGGGGAAWSDDGGETWHPADEGRDRHYTWSVSVDPGDADLWYVSASTDPFAAHRGSGDPQARIYRRRNTGWEP